MSQQLTPILEVVKEIVKPAGLKGMHVDEIAEIALRSNKNMGLSKEDFSRKIQGALASHLKLKSIKPVFARVDGNKKGTFKKGWYRTKIEKFANNLPQIQAPQTSKDFLGKAGELAVMSELLFWGFNASAMLVDSGIDLIASKGNKYFHIQVKTSSDAGGRFGFSIKQSSFTSNHDSSMFYVFVLRTGLACEFIVLPSSDIRTLVTRGVITDSATYSITITRDAQRKKYILNGRVDIGIHLHDFKAIH